MHTEVVGSNLGDLARAAAERDTPSHVIDEPVSHEGDHAREDTEGYGVFGLLIVPGIEQTFDELNATIVVFEREVEIVVGAFYRPIGDRTLGTMANIASAPGYADMSEQDWNVYHHAQTEKAKEEKRADEHKPYSEGSRGDIFPIQAVSLRGIEPLSEV